MPVAVRAPLVGPTAVNATNGAVIRNAEGYQVTIAPGALGQDATVTITALRADQLEIPPLPAADGWIFGTAFSIDTQDIVVDQPMQLAVPTALAAGTLVRFYHLVDLSDDPNVEQLGWAEVETGIVGVDGIARSTSHPHPGINNEGTYIVAAKQGNTFPNLIPQETSVRVPETTAMTPPLITDAEVRFAQRNGETSPQAWLVITGQNFTYHTPKSPDLGDPTKYLRVVFNPANKEIRDTILANPGSQFVDNFQDNSIIAKIDAVVGNEIWVKIPNDLNFAIGSGEFSVARLTYAKTPNDAAHPKSPYAAKTTAKLNGHSSHWEVYSVYSNHAQVLPTANDVYVAVANGDMPNDPDGKSDQLAVLRPMLMDDGLTWLPQLIARIPVGDLIFGTDADSTNPYQVAISPDGTRAYVTMRFGAGVAVVDTMTWKQIDVSNTRPGSNIISFVNAPNAQPFDIVFDPSGKYAYVSDEGESGSVGTIYVIDTDPTSRSFNQHVMTLNTRAVLHGLRGLAITPQGDQLIVSAPSVPHYVTEASNKRTASITVYRIPDIAQRIRDFDNGRFPEDNLVLIEGITGNYQDPEGLRVITGSDGNYYMSFVDAQQDTVGISIFRQRLDGVWVQHNRIPLNIPGSNSELPRRQQRRRCGLHEGPQLRVRLRQKQRAVGAQRCRPDRQPRLPGGKQHRHHSRPLQTAGDRLAVRTDRGDASDSGGVRRRSRALGGREVSLRLLYQRRRLAAAGR